MNILFINNYDSFVYNLVNYFCQLAPNANITIEDNNISVEKVEEYSADKIIISPGPGHPKYDTGTVIPIIKKYFKKIPILGICLGHQAIVESFGENQDLEYVGRAKVGPMHGKESKVFHDQESIFEDIPNPLMVIRYHSLSAKSDLLPQELKITATADDGTIMGVRHKNYPVEGVQFHPESIRMKPHGMQILKNFLELKIKR
ncbi:MAG: aminodeoxychorismate/anthranilate synthase component II [Promethearchaeota archaeon]|nr:MAG: aminodeoxychorismate/anthranilate synthase component II [Candidatus Lokiarchaeota archaeon]